MSEQVLDQILQEMRQGFATVNGRLDRVEGRLDRVESRLDVLEVGQTELRQAVVELQSSMNRMESVRMQQSEAIDSLRNELKHA